MTVFGVRMNAANSVTILRMILIPVFMVALLTNWPAWVNAPALVIGLQPWIAAFVFTLLAATDGVDGYLARSRNEVTTFGKFIDPLADKLLVTAALVALVELHKLPGWIALVIVSREFIVSGLRMVASAEGIVIAASWYGKVKTVFQIIAIVMFIIMDSTLLAQNLPAVMPALKFLSWTVMLIAVVMTILSMVDYFRGASHVLVGPWTGEAGLAAAAESAESTADDETDETTD